MGRDIELLGKNLPVARGLAQHIDVIAVFKDVLHLTGGKQVFDVLGDAGGNAAPFTESLPDFHRVGGSLIFLQEQVHFVNVVAGGFMGDPVDGDTVPNLILHNQHPDFLELLAQLLDVVADHAAVNIHIGAVVKDVQGAGDVDFQRGGNVLCFFFVLLSQFVIQVLQNRHFLRAGVAEIIAIDQPDTAVNDGFLHRLQALLAADNQLAQGENEVGFQGKWVFVLTVIEVQVHGIDEVGGRWRDFDDLPVQALNQRPIFGFGVTDDNIVIGDKEHIGDFALCGEGFTGTGRTENQAVGVFEQLAVYHDKVVTQGVQPAVKGFFARLEKLLGGKGYKNSDARCSQASLYLDLVVAQRQAAHQSFLLPEVQLCQRTVIFLGDGACLKYIVVELLLAVGGVQDDKGQKKHTLVAALKVLQQLFGFTTIGGKVGRNQIHIISGSHRLFLLIHFHAVKIGDFALDGLDCLDLIHGLNVHGDNEGAFHVEEVRQHTVIQLRREDLQERYAAELFPHAKAAPVAELKGAGCDKVLDRQPGGCQPVPRELERHFLIHMEHPVHHAQTLHAVQQICRHAQTLEVIENVRFNAFQTGLCGAKRFCFYAKGEILGLNQTVIAARKLTLQHLRVFGADAVKIVAPGGNGHAPGKAVLRCGNIHEGKLKLDGAVKVVEEVAPAVKDGGFILVLVELIVDVLKLNGFGIGIVRHAADAVREHPLKRDAVLRRFVLFILLLGSCDCRFDLLLFGAGEFSLG